MELFFFIAYAETTQGAEKKDLAIGTRHNPTYIANRVQLTIFELAPLPHG